MGAIGGSSGYLTVNPTEDYIGNAVNGVQNQMNQYRLQKQQQDQLKLKADQLQQEQNRQEFNDARDFKTQNPYMDMGNGSVDATNKNNLVNLQKAYLDAKRNYTTTRDPRQQAIADSAYDNIKLITDGANALASQKQKLIDNSTSYNQASLNKTNGIINRISSDLQVEYKDGHPVYNLVKRDPATNDIIGVERANMNAYDVKNMLDPTLAFDPTEDKGMLDQYQKRVGSGVDKTETIGNNKITTKSYPGADLIAKEMATQATKNKPAVYHALEQLQADPNISDINKAKLDPENPKSYSDPFVLSHVSNYYENLMGEKTKDVKSTVRDLDLARFQEEKNQHAISQKNFNTTRQDGIESDKNKAEREVAKQNEEKNTVHEEHLEYKDPLHPENPTSKVSTTQVKKTQGNNSSQQKQPDTQKVTQGTGVKKYSSTQEQAISAALKKNPGYSRSEIISALKI